MQDNQNIIRFLHTVPLFQGLGERQLQRLAKRFKERTYAKGEAIVNQGTMGIGLFILESGRADVIYDAADGDRTVVNQLGSTDFFGELSLLDDAPRTASVVATEDAKCLVLAQLDFMDALREDADIPIVMLREMARRLRRIMQTL
ncbi:MAG TPA: cyclic nucleotide-binding domain-containing protein [Aggregatilineales bacterium]|nr:cyclic nucleotide-binding domain-containing protein [Anaerolineae bacterium]HUN07249.1 cyclic nucleotide-binding domain-containing protein [Aggregatilineales bacterium]